MTAKTITFSLQIGSGGFEIAKLVAEKLGYRYYDWEVTSKAAEQAGVSSEAVAAAEQPRSGFARLVEKLLGASAYPEDEGDILSPTAATMTSAITALTSDDYRAFIERVVSEVGAAGEGVIVGHAAQIVLRTEAGVLKVLITGSTDRRAQRLAVEAQMSEEQARAEVQRSDRERIAFFKQVYKVDLLDASLYDLTLNTDQLPITSAADIVLAAAEALLADH